MGWANCGSDSNGRHIGYAHQAKCDKPGCDNTIDRGLSYACGDMHDSTEYSCEKYFCEDHMRVIEIFCIAYKDGAQVCEACQQYWEEEHIKECDLCAQALQE